MQEKQTLVDYPETQGVDFGGWARYYNVPAEVLQREHEENVNPGITIREFGDHPGSFAYPGLDEKGMVIPELWDGEWVPAIPCDSLSLRCFDCTGDEPRETDDGVEEAKIPMQLVITNSRIILYCKNFDTGTAYIGLGPISLVAGGIATAVSKGKAAKRSAGKAIYGHVRYEWLHRVTFVKGGLVSPGVLMFSWLDTYGQLWNIALGYSNKQYSKTIANLVIPRLARYKLAMQGNLFCDDEKADCHRFLQGGEIPYVDPKEGTEVVFQSVLAPMGMEFRPAPEALR